MLEAHGLLRLTMRSESSHAQAQSLSRSNPHHAGSKPDGSAAGNSASKSTVTLPQGATAGPMKEFWQQAADKAAQTAPSADTMKKLREAGKSDNKEIAAQKMQQAKANLQSLRMQAQLAAASGDKQQLRRLAQEVAAAAREVATAARDLAGGIIASGDGDTGAATVPLTASGADTSGQEDQAIRSPTDATAIEAATDTAGAGGKEAATHGDTAVDRPPVYAQTAPETGDKQGWSEKALNSLSTDANNAIAQARGLLAFIATAARGKRRSGETDDDRFFNELQRMIDNAQGEVNQALSDAGRALAAESSDAIATGNAAGALISDSLFGLENVSTTQTIITTVTTTALFVNITT